MNERPAPIQRAAATLYLAIVGFCGFALLLLLALVIGGLTGAGYWLMLIPVVMGVLFVVAVWGGKK
jgi:peptidoglycan/LPS O-acetylase OafA/YrhL